MTTARKSVKPQAVKPQAEPEVKCTRVEADAVRAPEPALPVAAEYDPGPPPIQCGVGRPRVPPAHHEDGRKRAGDYVLGAVRLQAETAAKPGDFLNGADNRLADSWLQEATCPVEGTMMTVAGGELLPAVLNDAEMDSALGAIKNTVDEPNYITADASRDRIQLAFDAGALETGLDLSESIGAANSLEKMMAHQLAATHRASMKLVQQLTLCIERMDQPYNAEAQERANVQGTRLAGAVARMQGSFQSGMVTLQKMRSGGRQEVKVTHVHQAVQVNEGGQAVVAGNLEGGRGSAQKKGGDNQK